MVLYRDMDDIQAIKEKLDEQAKKIDAIVVSVEKTRKYFLGVLWITVLAIVLPLIGLVTVLPSFLESYLQALGG